MESQVAQPLGGATVAAVGAALTALPFVIVSAGPFIHMSSSTLPAISIPQTSSIMPSRDAVAASRSTTPVTDSALVVNLSGLVQGIVSSGGAVTPRMKTVPRLSRLNAVDLSVTAAADPSVTVTTASPALIQPSFTAGLQAGSESSSESPEVEREILRREIAPIPGAVCSAEEAVRVGSSYLCSVCGKTFQSAPQLAVHHHIHYFERQFKCTVCRSSFASRAALEQHRSREHRGDSESVTIAADPRPFKCDECGVAFRIQGHLAKHKRSKVHAARLENNPDTSCSADTEKFASVVPQCADEMVVVEDEQDECEQDASCHVGESSTLDLPEQSDGGEACRFRHFQRLLCEQFICCLFGKFGDSRELEKI